MKIEPTSEAKQQAREENAWWRKNRDHKGIFSEELRAARKVLKDGPKHQIYAYIGGEPVRRLLLEKTRCRVYYVVFEREKLVRSWRSGAAHASTALSCSVLVARRGDSNPGGADLAPSPAAP